MKNFNSWLAIKITDGVATMTCCYFFAVLAIIGFPYSNMTAQTIIQWLSQTFIQLTMLSILAVSQKMMSDQAKSHHSERLELAHKHHKSHLEAIKRIKK